MHLERESIGVLFGRHDVPCMSIPSGSPQQPKFNWTLAAILAFGPSILSFLTLLFDSSNYGESAMMVAIFGSILSGIVFAVHTGMVHADKGPVTYVSLALLFGTAFAVITFALCFGGCAIAGNLSKLF